jgi:hypothetical protein
MKTPFVIVATLAGTLVMSQSIGAHHGSAAFDTGKRVTLKATVKEWVYANPHCLLRFEVVGDDNKPVQWIAEGQAPNVIFPVGYRKDSFKAGEQVTLTLEPVKNGLPMGRIMQAVLADGKILGPANSPPPAAGATAEP